MQRSVSWIFAIVLLLACAAAGPAVAAACNEQVERGRQIAGNGGLGLQARREQLQVLHADTKRAGCELAATEQIGRYTALTWVREIAARLQAGATLEQVAGELAAIKPYYETWQVHAWQGELAERQRHWQDAALRYQLALEVMNDPNVAPKPPRERILAVAGLAQKAALLAPDYRPAPRRRTINGDVPGGVMAWRVRDVEIVQRDLPIEFVFGQIVLTAKGEAAMRELCESLSEMPPGTGLRLAGHTDPVGSRPFNLQLSLQRARVVEARLRACGATAGIEVEGKGFEQPPTINDPQGLCDPAEFARDGCRAQLHQISRRVEIERR